MAKAPKDQKVITIAKVRRKHRDGLAVRKQQFLDRLALALDEYVDRHDEVPDGLAYVLGGVFQANKVGWLIVGDSEGGADCFLGAAHVALVRELGRPIEDEDAGDG